jgi:nitroimidazol reductase NimA-like FMN-containing flavoprotein (pyridoxamine 5'-phosphate oxidase superfamily)
LRDAVTLIDGLVLARSAFHHSMNYRSVVLLGTATAVEDPAEQLVAFESIVNHVVPGRWPHVRQPTPQELKATLVLKLPIDEGSAKVRAGMPVEDDADRELPVWGGILPLRLLPQAPISDDLVAEGMAVPAEVRDWKRPTAS